QSARYGRAFSAHARRLRKNCGRCWILRRTSAGEASMTQANPGPKHDDCSESLSRLIDGELDDGACRALFQRLQRDTDARRTWVLLNIACDAVRSSETAALHSATFVARVGAALDAEPVILAPGAARRRALLLRRVGLPAAAVAAAVVVLAVVAVPQL